MNCGATVNAPALAESTLHDNATRTVECDSCGAHVEFIYNVEHEPFGARLVMENHQESPAD